jgi:streptomycin 6-kinase
VPLTVWFQALAPFVSTGGGVLARAAATARELLATPRERVVLHGDVHHDNVLDFGPRGWLAIDPKGLYGERGFDYANILRNPDHPTATAPGRLARHVTAVADAARLDRRRLIEWVLALAGLSVAWGIADGDACDADLAIAELAVAELRA